jgi:hypothetical protein
VDVRLPAAVYVRTFVRTHWKSLAVLPADQRAAARDELLSTLLVAHEGIVKILADAFRRVVLTDFVPAPASWPELVPQLRTGVQTRCVSEAGRRRRREEEEEEEGGRRGKEKKRKEWRPWGRGCECVHCGLRVRYQCTCFRAASLYCHSCAWASCRLGALGAEREANRRWRRRDTLVAPLRAIRCVGS